MSTYVQGFKPPNEKWKKMKKAWDACADAGIGTPEEVDSFFGNEFPDEAGVKVEIEEHECCSEIEGNAQTGFEIDVTKLPKDVTVIRFVNSW
jgi:hypothetical protein